MAKKTKTFNNDPNWEMNSEKKEFNDAPIEVFQKFIVKKGNKTMFIEARGLVEAEKMALNLEW